MMSSTRKALPVLFLVMFLVMLGFGIVIPVLPLYARELGASSLTLGWLMATYSFMNLLFSPIWGNISDRMGRKPVMLIGLLGFGIAYVAFGLATELWQLFVSRILAGALSAAAMPTAMAYVADITTEETRGKGMGMIGAAAGLGFIFGPAIGGSLSKWGYDKPFIFAGMLAALTFIVASIVLKESLPKEKRRSHGKKTSRWAAFRGSLVYLYIMSFVVSFSLAGLESTFAFYAVDKLHMTSVQLGYVFVVMGVVGAFIQGGLIGKLIKRFGEDRVIQIGLLVSAIGFILIVWATDIVTGAIFLAVFGAGNGMIRPSVSALISKRTTSGQGNALGLLGSLDSLGRIAGPPVGGLLYAKGMTFPYYSGAIMSIVALLLLFYFQKLVQTREDASV
jgi:DHA1 family multidrug resistance protein-like MFS transporter